MSSLAIKAPAKVNLGLRVLGMRSDGYHEVETILQTVDLCDTLLLEETAGEIVLSCAHQAVPEGPENLACRAALLLRKAAKMDRGARITLRKNIPVAAGLGGGSSDAASTLIGLNLLWGEVLDEDGLFELASSLGCDVPFFLRGGAAYASGRGDQLRFLDHTLSGPVVLVNPGFSISTAWAYKQWKFNLTNEENLCTIRQCLSGGRVDELMPFLPNGLENGVIAQYPLIDRLKVELRSRGARGVCMSGSGPTVLGIFSSEGEAREAAEWFAKRWWARAVRPLKGGELFPSKDELRRIQEI